MRMRGRCYCGHPSDAHQPVENYRAGGIFDLQPCTVCGCADYAAARVQTVEDTKGRL